MKQFLRTEEGRWRACSLCELSDRAKGSMLHNGRRSDFQPRGAGVLPDLVEKEEEEGFCV